MGYKDLNIVKIINEKEICEFIENNQKLILFFSANWCKFCTKLENNFEKLFFYKKKYEDFKVFEADFEKTKNIADKKFNIKMIPSLFLIIDKKIVGKFEGYSEIENLFIKD